MSDSTARQFLAYSQTSSALVVLENAVGFLAAPLPRRRPGVCDDDYFKAVQRWAGEHGARNLGDLRRQWVKRFVRLGQLLHNYGLAGGLEYLDPVSQEERFAARVLDLAYRIAHADEAVRRGPRRMPAEAERAWDEEREQAATVEVECRGEIDELLGNLLACHADHFADVREALLRMGRRLLAHPECADGLGQQVPPETDPTKRLRRRRKGNRKPQPLTPAQTEAMQLVGEHKGDFTAAGKAAGKTRQAMKKLYDKACRKLGKKTVESAAKTQRLPADARGQSTVADPNATNLNAPDPADTD